MNDKLAYGFGEIEGLSFKIATLGEESEKKIQITPYLKCKIISFKVRQSHSNNTVAYDSNFPQPPYSQVPV